MAREVKMDRIDTPTGSLRTLYAGSEYTLDDAAAEEMVGKGSAHYTDTTSEPGSDSGSSEATGASKGPSVEDLKKRAKELGVEGYSSMNKAALEAAIAEKEAS